MPSSTLPPTCWALKDYNSLRIAVVESSIEISRHDACTVFHIILENETHHFSLIRYIQDFHELDNLIYQHFPKHHIPLPKLYSYGYNSNSLKTSSSSSSSRTSSSILSSLFFKKSKKKTKLISNKKKKSNSVLLQNYLSQSLRRNIGKSSIFRDFLSAQRDEDTVISKLSVRQLVAQHQPTLATTASTVTNAVINAVIEEHQEPEIATPPSTICSNRSIADVRNLYINHQATRTISLDQHCNDISEAFSQNADDISIRYDSGLSASCSSSKYSKETTEVKEEEMEFIEQIENLPVSNELSNPHTIKDYQLIQVLGKGATGKVILVKHHKTQRLFALKAITKAWSITKREVEHVRTERNILASLASIRHPFLIRLFSAFQDQQNLYLVLDYHAGADLATLLQRYICFPPEQCRLYAAEIVTGLQELHRHCILYRDLKPENVLLAKDGHIVLTDFGLSKMFSPAPTDASFCPRYDHRTTTFCGTPEYLAPEIILQQEGEEGYSYAADFWSLGTMLYEMLLGTTPFAADTPEEMYDRVLYDDLTFPRGFKDVEAMDLIAGLLERNPVQRLGAGLSNDRKDGVFELRTHPYFANHLDWKEVYAKRIQPIYVPSQTHELDFSHFDQEFLDMSTQIIDDEDNNAHQRNFYWLPDSSAKLFEESFQGYSYICPDQASVLSFKSEVSYFSEDYQLKYDPQPEGQEEFVEYDSNLVDEEEEEQYFRKNNIINCYHGRETRFSSALSSSSFMGKDFYYYSYTQNRHIKQYNSNSSTPFNSVHVSSASTTTTASIDSTSSAVTNHKNDIFQNNKTLRHQRSMILNPSNFSYMHHQNNIIQNSLVSSDEPFAWRS
ncbi:kinase-like domain-containing protein [Mycotypha africana]|uniref:kinase-like domain-containing protein n=1 Tax=Mycotypha africana TaxID=64632 RepID=UPI002301886E|nr:kinase-like domain-containing protein [Mycotypha africana]KAI8979508.1 kinase-like domain-containing protein [Mycotypha africana]